MFSSARLWLLATSLALTTHNPYDTETDELAATAAGAAAGSRMGVRATAGFGYVMLHYRV